MQLKIGNRCTRVSEEEYDWTVYVQSDAQNSVIESVLFGLHETFTPNVLLVDQAPFEITRRGWGEFDVKIQVKLINVAQVLHFEHPLCFDSSDSYKVHDIDVPQQQQSQNQFYAIANYGSIVNSHPIESDPILDLLHDQRFGQFAAVYESQVRNYEEQKQAIQRSTSALFYNRIRMVVDDKLCFHLAKCRIASRQMTFTQKQKLGSTPSPPVEYDYKYLVVDDYTALTLPISVVFHNNQRFVEISIDASCLPAHVIISNLLIKVDCYKLSDTPLMIQSQILRGGTVNNYAIHYQTEGSGFASYHLHITNVQDVTLVTNGPVPSDISILSGSWWHIQCTL